jgi:hypothetical protein
VPIQRRCIAIGLIWQTILYASGLIGVLAQARMAAGRRQGRGAGRVGPGRGALVIDAIAHAQHGASANASRSRPTVLVLGAALPASARRFMLARSGKADVLALERQSRVGGNSGSFELDGVHCDYGSHRLHPATEPHVMAVIEDAVGDDLIWRPRHGRILLKQPLDPFPIASARPRRQAAQALRRIAHVRCDCQAIPQEELPVRRRSQALLRESLGPAISENFYYPYVRKLWALPPEELSVTLARRRVSGNSIGKILQKMARQVPGPPRKAHRRLLLSAPRFRRDQRRHARESRGSGRIIRARRIRAGDRASRWQSLAQCAGRRMASRIAAKPTPCGRRCPSRRSCGCSSRRRLPRSSQQQLAYAFAG